MNLKLMMAMSLLALLPATCKISVAIGVPGFEIRFTAEINTDGEEAGEGKSLGRGTAEFEDGTKLEGEFFDTDDDGKADKFKPDANQGEDSEYGTTNGTDWYDINASDG